MTPDEAAIAWLKAYVAMVEARVMRELERRAALSGCALLRPQAG